MHRLVIALTGASGMPYGLGLLKALSKDHELHLIVSKAAQEIIGLETPADSLASLQGYAARVYDDQDLAAGPASGSWPHAGMVVCPCSMASLAAISQGVGSNLIHRAADVCLKERRRLVLVPRETPLNAIQLKNMLDLTRAGAVILPASPGFYHRPKQIADLVEHLVGRILDQLDLAPSWAPRWKSPETTPTTTGN
jgi:4-hydroxy-3-polyprenylbenzoate decarboxylase